MALIWLPWCFLHLFLINNHCRLDLLFPPDLCRYNHPTFLFFKAFISFCIVSWNFTVFAMFNDCFTGGSLSSCTILRALAVTHSRCSFFLYIPTLCWPVSSPSTSVAVRLPFLEAELLEINSIPISVFRRYCSFSVSSSTCALGNIGLLVNKGFFVPCSWYTAYHRAHQCPSLL